MSSLQGDLTSSIVAAYPLDEEFRGILHDLQNGVPPASASPFSLSPDGLLWFHRPLLAPQPLLCIPAACRTPILRIVHDDLGHPGHVRALAHARSRFHWSSMSRDIRSYCPSCHLCQVCKTDTAKKPGCLQPIPVPPCPFHTICIDFIEGLPTALGGLNSIATITEKFSKAIRLVACKKSDSGDAFARRFFQLVYPMWGVPSRMVCDRDRRFVSGFWSTLMSLAGCKVNMTAAYHPQADGQAERTNRTMESILRILCLEASSHCWSSFLPHIELAYNTTLSSSTGFSPYSILYASSPRLFGDHALPLLDDVSADGEALASSLRERRLLAGDAMLSAQASQKRYFDSHHSPLIFLPGDWAMLVYSGTLKRPHKLAPSGSVVQILEAISPVAYRIRVPPGSRMHDVISIEHLRRYRKRSPSSSPPPRSPSTRPAPSSPPPRSPIARPTSPLPVLPDPVTPLCRVREGRREVLTGVGEELVWKLDVDEAPALPIAPPPRRSARLALRR